MPFWNNVTMEPYRGFRWKIQFAGIGPAYFAMKVDKPSFKIGEYTHKYLNHSFFYPGRVEWAPISCTIVDAPGKTGGAHQLMKALTSSGYALPTHGSVQKGYDGVTKGAATASFATGGIITITQLEAKENSPQADANGSGTHKNGNVWRLHNAWVQDIKMGSLDYSNEDAVTIDLVIRYDYAILS